MEDTKIKLPQPDHDDYVQAEDERREQEIADYTNSKDEPREEETNR